MKRKHQIWIKEASFAGLARGWQKHGRPVSSRTMKHIVRKLSLMPSVEAVATSVVSSVAGVKKSEKRGTNEDD